MNKSIINDVKAKYYLFNLVIMCNTLYIYLIYIYIHIYGGNQYKTESFSSSSSRSGISISKKERRRLSDFDLFWLPPYSGAQL